MPKKPDPEVAEAEEETTPARPVMTISLGDNTLPVPSLASLSLSETFAVLNSTGNKAEVLWAVNLEQPFGRATLSAWWWIARGRQVGRLMPLSIVDRELNEAAEAGIPLEIGFDGPAPEESDPEG